MTAIERILVLDDSDANALFWEMLLKSLNVPEVLRARAGAEAIEMVETGSIHMVIVAWELASMPGPIVVQKIRSSRKRRRMPFLIYSKSMSAEDIALIKQLGLENILPSPLDKAQAGTMVETIMDAAVDESPIERKLRAMEESIAAGRPAEVLKMVGPDVAKKGPHLKRYKVVIAETFLKLGSVDKAEKALGEALAIDPDYMPAKYLQARLYTATGKHDEAIKMLEELSKQSPKNVSTLLNLGDAYTSADQLEKAQSTVDKARALDPDSQELKDSDAKLAIKKGNLEMAAQLLANTENGDEMARFYNSMGISLVAKGEFDKGIATYKSAIDVLATKAKFHLLLFNLGLAYRKKNDLGKSLEYLCQSYVADPSYEKSYSFVARTWQEMQDQKIAGGQEAVKLVKDTRQKYLAEHPQQAEAIKKRLAERKAS